MKTSPNYSLRTVFKESQVPPYRKRFACFSGPFPGRRTKNEKRLETLHPYGFGRRLGFTLCVKDFPFFLSSRQVKAKNEKRLETLHPYAFGTFPGFTLLSPRWGVSSNTFPVFPPSSPVGNTLVFSLPHGGIFPGFSLPSRGDTFERFPSQEDEE